MKKKTALVLFLVLASLFLISCSSTNSPTNKNSGETTVWEDVLSIGKLEFLGVTKGENAVSGFMRLMIGLLVFAILFELSRVVGLTQNIGIVIAAILSIMSIIFIPSTLLVAIGGTYATVVALFLIGIPVAGGAYALFRIPSTSTPLVLLKVVIILLLIFILNFVKQHALTLLAV